MVTSTKKYLIGCLLALTLTTVGSGFADPVPFRIGTGGSSGTYLPIGSLIARGISAHNICGQVCAENNESKNAGLNTDVSDPSWLALAQRSNGSAANVSDIGNGLLEAGLAQADVVHWAYNGVGAFTDKEPILNLRTVATLYLESLHLIVKSDSDIMDLQGLVGKQVSIDEIGSGTQLNVQQFLSFEGIDLEALQLVYLKPIDAIDRMRLGQLDAFFVVAGYPVSSVSELISDGVGRIVPIKVQDIAALVRDYPFFTRDTIPRNTYGNDVGIETLAVPAQLVVDANLDDDLIYRITSLLWSDRTLRLVREGHPKGSEFKFTSALAGVSAPLHPGAERYYRQNAHPLFTADK